MNEAPLHKTFQVSRSTIISGRGAAHPERTGEALGSQLDRVLEESRKRY